MKNRRVGIISVITFVIMILLATYVYHETNDDPSNVILKWSLKNRGEIAEYMRLRYDPSHEECDAYCKLASGEWLSIRVEKGFLGTWHVVHVEEIPFEELPKWVHEHIDDEPEALKDWEEKHRGEWEKIIYYDEYASYDTIYYAKLKTGKWLRLGFEKNTFGDWDIEEKEIGTTPEEIAERLCMWYKEGEITMEEIERFLETLARDGMDTDFICNSLRAKGVPLGKEKG
ncbi:MAG: hypothetical protein KAV48_04755 [Methanomicrobia archaeon]|nr:hypothetical protein [Methanomicrobia archaeon]